MGRKRKNKKIQTFEVYPEDLGRYQHLMNDLPEYETTGETDEDIDDEQFQLMQKMMRDNPEMFKNSLPRYNTSLHGSKDDYKIGHPTFTEDIVEGTPLGAMLGLFGAGKNLVKGVASGFKTKYHGTNPETGLKYSMQDFKRHTITNPFDDTRLISADVAKDIIYNKNKDYTRGDLFKTSQQANSMLMNDYFRDRHELYKDADDPTKAAFSLRTMDEFGNVKYSDIEAPNPNWDPDLINPDGTSVLSGNVEPQFITRPFNILTDLTQGDRVEDHLANASMQQMYYDNEGVITKFQSYNDDGELVWTNYNPNVEYGEYETTSQEEMNRRLNDPDYQGTGRIGDATDPFGTDVDVSEESVESNQDRQNRIRCEEENKVYNPQTGQCEDAPVAKYGGALPKFQEEGEYPNNFLTGFPTLEEAQNFDPTLLFAEEEEEDDTPELNTEEQRQNWANLQEEVQYEVATNERNKLQDVALQDTDVTSSWRDEGEKGIPGALAGAYRWADARFKTGVPGRIVKGMGDIGGLLDPIHALSEASRISNEKKEAELLRTGKTSEDMFATMETSSRGDWDPYGGMFKPDKSVDEIRGTAQGGKEMTLTGSTPQGGADYSMLQEFTGDDLPFPYDPAFLEWQKLTLGINGGDLPKAQTGNKEKIKDYKNVWGTNKRETNAIIEDLINQGFDFETDTILRNPQATELRRAQNAFLDANARENIFSGNITGEPSTNRSSWGDYMYQAYEKFFNKQDGGQTVDIDSAMLKELIAAGADIEII